MGRSGRLRLESRTAANSIGTGGHLTEAATDSPDARKRQPAWFARAPELELDCRDAGLDGMSVFRSVIRETQRLLPGQMIAIRIGFEPAFLCRALAGKGFIHWPEPLPGGGWKIYFARRAERSRLRKPRI